MLRHTAPHVSQSNGLAENANRMIKTALRRNLAAHDTRPWPEIVYLIVGIHRATPHESMGFTPFQLRTNSLPYVDYRDNSKIAEAGGRDTRAALKAKAKRYADLMERAVPKLARKRERMTELAYGRQVHSYEARNGNAGPQYQYKLGDLEQIRKCARDRKLAPKFSGCFRVVELGPNGANTPGRRQLIAQELIAPIVQLADDLSPDVYSQSDDSPAPYIFERSLDPYIQWTACLEEPRDEDTLPSRQEYLKPYDIIPHAFYPRAEEVVIDDDDDDEEDEDEETSEEGNYSEHSEGELSEEEEEEEEAGSEWEAPPEEATRTETEAEDPEAARRREEIAIGKRQLEFASGASLRIGNDPTRDPEPPRPEDGGPAAATSSTARRRRSRSSSSSNPTCPPVRPRTDAGDRPSSSHAVPPTP
ncbi:hypothetical protein CBR_g45986 [Chara braunii]|uniref:Integrase catalytic domain-containing protein n=1 Tax=Chara braunii TaxID=69332 RepID=A0A388LZT2_CHABU|nr:hypothetical protein CBR_g45986 [Chara braunii]|eukprot:GBG87830.1 hypothetical protein CBR_g45986 [Chara braunii]